MEIDFESTSLERVSAPEFLSPRAVEAQRSQIHAECILAAKHAASITLIHNRETYSRAIEIGQLLQVIAKNVDEFYKPIKQAFDERKKIVLDMEREDATVVKTERSRLALLVQQFEAEEAAEIARRLAEEREKAASVQLPGSTLPAPVIVQTAPPKVKGRVGRVSWYAQVDDLSALVKAVAVGQAPANAVEADQKFLDKRADADREGFSIPGVTAHRKETVHFRS